MTLNIELSPEQEAALRAKAGEENVSMEAYAKRVLERELELLRRDDRHISELISELWRDVPLEEFESLPKDGAAELDHYIYGSPKRNQ